MIKFIYFEKATKFCEIFTLLLTCTTYDKSKVKISQNFVAFSEYMNFTHKNNAKCITTTDRGVLMETEMLRSYVLPQGSSNATE